MNFTRDISWPPIAGRKARLVHLKNLSPGTFAEHKDFLLRTWPKLYRETSEIEFREKYDNYVLHLQHFNGCCKVNEVIEICETDKQNVLLLSKDWKGEITDHSDIEIWLRKTTTLPFIGSGDLTCEIYTFGTLVTLPGDEETFHGAKPGKSRISHKSGIYKVSFDNNKLPRKISLVRLEGTGANEAIFELV